jgi:hypothetical protein
MGIASFQPPVTTPVKGTSLGEMMNMAQGAQALQQARQLNPLQIQQAQGALELQRLQTSKAQQTLEPEVELAKTTAEQAKTQLNDAQLLNLQKQQANSSRNLIKMLDLTEPVTPARIKDHVVATMANAGASDAAIMQAVQDLPTKGTDKELRAYLAKHVLNSLTAEAELEKRFPAATMVGEGGQMTPRQLGAEAFTGVQPGTAMGKSIAVTPNPMQPGVTTVNGIIGQYDATGKFVPFNVQPGQQPSNLPAPGMAPTPAPSAAGQNKMPSIVKIDNFSAPGQQNTQEVARYNAGQADFNAANERATLAQDSALTAQNIKKNLSAAAGSAPGRVLRSIGQTVIGDPQLDILVKSLADQQLRQSQLMGLKNQAAEADQRTAGGSSEITAEALAHIVERAEATNLAASKYNQALTKMQEKYGKERTYLNNDNFKNAWANSYNPIAFIIQNTNRQNIPQKDKDKIIDYYTHDMSRDQLDTLANNMKNLKRLERGDF